MGFFSKILGSNDSQTIVRCDEAEFLIWKYQGGAVKSGTSIIVKDGEVAVLVGSSQTTIEGPANTTASEDLSEVYFINLAKIIQVKFGVPFFDVYDPRFADFGVPVAVRGTVSFSISDYREFIKLHRLNNFSLDDFQKQIRDAACRYVKDSVANAPAAHSIPVIQLESKIAQINDAIEYDISERLKESFGVLVSGVDIAAIEIDKASDSYRQLMAVTKNIAATKIQAETADYVERLRIQREEGQYAQHKQTQTANLGAFQVEKQAEVGVAGAQALGQMGANGAGDVNIGGSGDGTGFNMAAMMASMAVGGAVGQNIAGAMNNMMDGIQQPVQSGMTPPPIPTAVYHVAINGQATGPFDATTLAQMVASGQLTANSLVWKNGMAQWATAGTVDELKNLLANGMPPIPTQE